MSLAPEEGMRFVLERARSADDAIVYHGEIARKDSSWALAVRVSSSPDTPDGLSAEARIEGAPSERREALERVAAAMARSAVRTARKDGRPPPHRIQRWRERVSR